MIPPPVKSDFYHREHVVLLQIPKDALDRCWAVRTSTKNWAIRSIFGIKSLSTQSDPSFSNHWKMILDEARSIIAEAGLEEILSEIQQ